MNPLLEKYQDYMRLDGCTSYYLLKNGMSISVPFLEKNFLHLLGLHKLVDIQLIQFWQDSNNRTIKMKDVIRAIKNETLTDSMVKTSNHFPGIKDRYNTFSYDSLTSLSYSNAIIDFDKSLAHSQIKSDYLLFEKKGGGYNHLGIAYDPDSNTRYMETFFYEPSNQYIVNQTIETIVEYIIYDKNNVQIVRDRF